MPLPQLQTYPGIETPKPADAMMRGQQLQRGQMQNALIGKQLQNYDEDRATEADTLKFTKTMKALEFSYKTSNTKDEFESNYKKLTGEDVSVEFSGKDITMQFPDKDGNIMEVSGPSEVVADAVSAFSKDPSNALDPEKGKKSFEWLARQGVSFKQIPGKPEKETTDIENYNKAVSQGYKGNFNDWYLNVKKASASKITTNVDTGLRPTTQTNLEENIISGEKNLDMLARLDEMYDENFLEYTGKTQAVAEDYLSKIGMSKGEYLQKRAKWASEVDTFTLLWRKHITGVAGGPQEMKAIEKTVINTKYDSPAKYKAKREQMEIMTKAAVAKDKAYLANGIDLKKMKHEQRAVISQTDPLSNYYPTAHKGIENLYEKYGIEK